jgi:acyl transferase domain-containing protein/NADPH:quinone reductase-like Zn-dependent oxidoreductase/SAM-dependent methyltransferase/acyl carrier protein
MSDSAGLDRRALVREALRTIDDLEARLAVAQSALITPIAIIGIGCRYPGGVTGPDSFWRLLARGGDAISEAPPDRWSIADWFDPDPAAPGKMSTRWGGFLEAIDRFDAKFFGIAPREATMLDPQHRLLLEVAVEALEHAGQPVDGVAGSRLGVFTGMTTTEYQQHLLRSLPPEALSPYLTTGNVMNAAPGRLAYFLGAHGPSVTVDTACSSSLTAVHLACQSLRAGDCQMALAGGVNVILAPETSVMFSKWGMMAADGRCKTFDAAADGFVRGEGCALLVLKPLPEAIARGDSVLAVIEGSAINQDGRSSGLTVPNGGAQEALIRRALANARVSPAEIDYLEAHGTGTRLGDPIEVDALSSVFAPDRPAERRLRIGSVKTNLGHTEAASGVAGLIKCVLALQHEEIPPQLHFQTPTPDVDWDRLPIDVVTRPSPWPKSERLRRAGVSSFGFSGANAHVVIVEAPTADPPLRAQTPDGRQILTLSARDKPALIALARRYATALQAPDAPTPEAFCYSANTGRSAYDHRAFACGQSRGELATEISRLADGGFEASATGGHGPGDRPKVAFLFTGQGSQYAGMGRLFYDTQPVFRAEMNRCAELLIPYLDKPLLDLCFGTTSGEALLSQTRYTQPALFSLEWSLAQLWRAFGVTPAAMLGHSLGEYVAACQAGVMALDDGLRLVAARAALMQALPPDGMMAAVSAEEATVRRIIEPYASSAAIAAVNGPQNVVISGLASSVEAILRNMEAQGLSAMPLNVSHAFHSPSLDPMLAAFETLVRGIPLHAPEAPVVSNLTGRVAEGPDLVSADYWRRHAREPVRFADGIDELKRRGCRAFIEIGPSPVLTNMSRRHQSDDTLWIPTMSRGGDSSGQFLNALGGLFVAGAKIDWAALYPDPRPTRCVLPSYPFQRKRFWVDAPSNAKSRPSTASEWVEGKAPWRFTPSPRSPLVRDVVLSLEISVPIHPWLIDHRVAGEIVLPMTALVAMAFAAAREVLPIADVAMEDLVIVERAVLKGDEPLAMQIVFSPDRGGDLHAFNIISLNADRPDGYVSHAIGRAVSASEGPITPVWIEDTADLVTLDRRRHLEALEARGIAFGPAFRGVARVRRRDGFALGEIDRGMAPQIGPDYDPIHPALLDVCLQPLVQTWPEPALAGGLLPFAIERIEMCGPPTERMTSHCQARRSSSASETMSGDISVYDSRGSPVVLVEGLTVRAWSNPAADSQTDQRIYEKVWRRAAEAHGAEAGANAWLSQPEVRQTLVQNLSAHVDDAARLGYAELSGLLHRRAMHHIIEALLALGWDAPRQGTFTTGEAAKSLGILPRYEPLLARFMDILSEAGCCERHGGGWIMRVSLESRAPVTEPGGQESVHAAAPELRLLDRCGARLADVLRGRAEPLDLLFGPGANGDLEAIYATSLTTTAINTIAADLIDTAAKTMPEGRALRILEIGAGTGGTTAHVLGRRSKSRTRYCFTDISPSLVARARSRFAEEPIMDFEVLDIERELGPQGFSDRQFDLVLAANVLHATANLEVVLARIRTLLEPAGLLVLIEGTRRQSWIDVTFGLTDGWWKAADIGLRGGYPLLGAPEWKAVLKDQGFTTPLSLDGPAAGGQVSDYTVFVASVERPEAPASRQETPASGKAPWLIFAADEAAERVGVELRRRGQACIMLRPGEAFEAIDADSFRLRLRVSADYERVLSEIADAGRRLRGVVFMWPLAARGVDSLEPPDLATESLLHLSRALTGLDMSLSDGLWAVTRGAQAVGPDVGGLDPAGAPIWGLAKVLGLEHPELNVRRVDLDPSAPSLVRDAAGFVDALLAPWANAECALRGDRLYEPQLVRLTAGQKESVRLVSTLPGQLDALAWRGAARRAPKAHEVEIKVEAAALNFRDVLSVLNIYPGEATDIGGEVAGTVVAIGPDVRDVAVGDCVAALAFGGFSTFVTTDAALTIRKPIGWSFADIVTVPAAFSTAYHALVQCAAVRPGERVLIHAASGGVGLAAIQLAQSLGCIIFATAGSPEKRDYLRSRGVAHVFDSRSVSFADDIRAMLPDRASVDVVVNTLAGALTDASLELLGPNGRFVELGRRELWDAGHAASIRPSATYFTVDLASVARQAPDRFEPIFAAASHAISEGALRPLPVQVFAADEVGDAFHLMARARHIGKVVVAPPRAALAGAGGEARFMARPDATFLVAGGLTGLGLRTAEWLAERGARHLVLVGRSAPAARAQATIDTLKSAGVNVATLPADIGVAAQVDRLFATLRAGFPALGGIIHSAGVLQDGAITRQTWPRMHDVLHPKISGAWNLHRASLDLPLDLFICYSSASAILGWPGQASHAAANTYLDALVHHRRALGLSGLSINWGAWSDIGAAAAIADRLANFGVEPITPKHGLAALERLILSGVSQAAAVNMNWERFLASQRPASEQTPFSGMPRHPAAARPASPTRFAGATANPTPPDWTGLGPAERRRGAESLIRTELIKVLGLEAEAVLDPYQGLRDLGLDSLMSVDLRNRLQTALQRAFPATLAFDFPTYAALVDHVCGQFAAPAETPTGSAKEYAVEATPSDLAGLRSLSANEAEALLLEELERTHEFLS